MSRHKKLGLAGLITFLFAGPSLAQSLGLGTTIGVVDDITDRFHVDEFKPKDVNLWVDYEVQEKVLVRATLGTLRVKGANAGRIVQPPGSPSSLTLPDLTNHVDYASVGVSYLFTESGGYTSGLFAGFGGYKIRPDSAPAEIAGYRDPSETAFGFHAGVEGGVQLISRLSLVLRITYHNIRSSSGRSLLTANAGLVYRF